MGLKCSWGRTQCSSTQPFSIKTALNVCSFLTRGGENGNILIIFQCWNTCTAVGWNLYLAPLTAWMFKTAGMLPRSRYHGWTAAIAWWSGTAICVWLRFKLASTYGHSYEWIFLFLSNEIISWVKLLSQTLSFSCFINVYIACFANSCTCTYSGISDDLSSTFFFFLFPSLPSNWCFLSLTHFCAWIQPEPSSCHAYVCFYRKLIIIHLCGCALAMAVMNV